MSDIRIRPLALEDAKTSYKWRNDPEIWRLTGSRPDKTITVKDETEWIKKVIADTSCRRFAIEVDGVYVGNIYLTDIVQNNDAQYHIFIGDRNYWGKGIASEASRQIIEFGRDKLHLQSIYLKVHEENAAAIHVYSKLGFLPSGKEGKFIVMNISLGDEHE